MTFDRWIALVQLLTPLVGWLVVRVLRRAMRLIRRLEHQLDARERLEASDERQWERLRIHDLKIARLERQTR